MFQILRSTFVVGLLKGAPSCNRQGRKKILQIHSKSINCEKNIRWELLARLCPNVTGAELRSVCTEAGMFAIRARRKAISEKDMLDAVQKVIKGYAKFSATAKYMVYN